MNKCILNDTVEPVDLSLLESPIVFIHGYISDCRIWDHLRFHWKGNQVSYFPTLSGFGNLNFGDNETVEFQVDSHVRDVVTYIENEVGRASHLVGWSYGASLALLLAAKRPDLVSSVYSYEAGMSGFITDHEAAMLVGKDRQNMVAPVIEALNRGDLRRAAKEMVNSACGVDSVFANLDVHDQQVFLDNAGTIPAMFEKNNDSPSSMNSVDLQEIRCRVTIGTGTLARPAYRIVGDEASKIIPNAYRQTVPTALHVVPTTNPQLFAAAIMQHFSLLQIGTP